MSARRLRATLLALLALACLHFAATAGAYSIDGDPDIVSEAAGAYDMFARGNLNESASDHREGHLFHQSFNQGVYWGWADLGQPSPSVAVVGKPSAISWGAGHIDVFVRGSDDYIYHRWFGSGAWWPWTRVSNFHIDTSPTAFSWSANRIDVFGRSSVDSASLMHSWYQAGANNNAFSDGESLGGSISSSTSVISWQPNHLDIFARWSSGILAHKWWDGVGGTGWSGWQGQSTSQMMGGTRPSVVQWGVGTIQAFFTRTDGALMMVPFVTQYGGWTPEQNFGGVLTSSPSAVTAHAGATDVFGRGTEGFVWHRWEDLASNYDWQGWSTAGAAHYTDGDPAAAVLGGYFGVVSRYNYGITHTVCCLGGWSAWTDIAPPIDPDTRAPTTSISGEIADHDGSEIYDYQYAVQANASDNRGVTTLEARVDGNVFGSVANTGSATFQLNGATLADGQNHTIQVSALDAAGNRGWSSTITVRKDPLVEDRAGVSEDDTPVTQTIGGPCGLGTTVTDCPSDTEDDTNFGRAVASHFSYSVRGGASNGSTIYGSGRDWLGMSEQWEPSAEQAIAATSNRLQYFRVMPRWNVEYGRDLPTTDPLRKQYDNLVDYVTRILNNHPERELLVSFDHEFGVKAGPTAAQYLAAIKAFLADSNFSRIRYFAPWNEPNLKGNPTEVPSRIPGYTDQQMAWLIGINAAHAADYFRELSLACHDRGTACRVLAGDFADSTGGVLWDRWLTAYTAFANDDNRAIGNVDASGRPYYPHIKAWAVHLHREANSSARLSDGNKRADWFDKFITETNGDSSHTGLPIWITEVGAISFQGSATKGGTGRRGILPITPVAGRAHRDPAGQDYVRARFVEIMANLAHRSTRVRRLFYYQWRGDWMWDSGLVDLDPNDPGIIEERPASQASWPATGLARPLLDDYKFVLAIENLVSRDPTGPRGTQQSRSSSVSFTTQPGTTSQCRMDDGAWADCTSPWTVSNLPDGSHAWRVQSVVPFGDGTVQVVSEPDNGGGSSSFDPDDLARRATKETNGFAVDATAPDTSIGTAPAAKTNATTASIGFSGDDGSTGSGVASYECRLDAAAWAACISPQALTGLAAGSHTFSVRATDNAANVDATPATTTWRIDTTAPDTTISASPAALTSATTGSVTFTGTDNDAVASYQCKLDGGSFAACTSPWALTGVSAGSHTAQVRAVDASGNADASPATVSWVVDTAAPDTTISSGPPASTTATTASIVFTGTDNTAVTAYECKLDSASYAACTSPKALTGLAVGSHTFTVRARDGAGNVDATPATTTWTITSSTGGVLMGDQTIESQSDYNGAGSIEAWPFTAAGTGTAVSVSAYIDAGNTATDVKVGIYSNSSSNTPQTLLASGTLSNPTAGSWVTVPLASSISVTAGTRYWVGLMSTVDGIRFRDHAVGGSCTGRATGSGLSAPPATWGTDVYSGTDCPGSIYVNAGSMSADTTPPDTTLSSGPPASTGSTSASMVFTGTDDVAVTAYECKLDSGSYAACTSPKLYTSLALGSHTFSVRARDPAGNVDPTPATTTWTVISGAAAVLMGNTAIEAYADPTGAGEAEGWPYTVGTTGTASVVSVYLDAGNTGTNLQLGIYTNNTDRPGTLLASGSLLTPTAGAWNVVPLTTTPTLTSGTRYWLVAGTVNGGMRIRDRQGGPCTARAMNMTAGTTLPTAWGTETYSGSECPASLYVSAP